MLDDTLERVNISLPLRVLHRLDAQARKAGETRSPAWRLKDTSQWSPSEFSPRLRPSSRTTETFARCRGTQEGRRKGRA